MFVDEQNILIERIVNYIMPLKFDPVQEYEMFKLRVEIGSRIKQNEIEIDHESSPIHLDIRTSFTGGVKRQMSVIEYIVSKIYAATKVVLRHSTIDLSNTGDIVSGGAIITVRDLEIFRSVIAKFSIRYKKSCGKSVKVYELLDVTIV